MNNSGKILTALATGVVIGVVAGALLAPDKGSKTREDISSDLKDLLAREKDKLADISEKISGVIPEKK